MSSSTLDQGLGVEALQGLGQRMTRFVMDGVEGSSLFVGGNGTGTVVAALLVRAMVRGGSLRHVSC